MSDDKSEVLIPKGWKSGSLGEFCEMYQPRTISTKELIDDGDYPVYGANGQIGFYNLFNHEDSEVTVTCRGATCGTVNVIPAKSWITGNAMVVRPLDNCMSKELLHYLLNSLDFTNVITGTAQPQITRTTLTKTQIVVPAPKEQKQIVEILEEQLSRLDAATVVLASAARRLKALTRSIAHAAVERGTEGLPLVELSKVLELHRGYDLPSQNRITGMVPIVASSGVVGRHIEPKVKGPGVVTGRSGTIGQVQVIEDDFWPLNTTLYVSDFFGNDFRYIALLLQSLNLQQHAGGSTVPSLDRNVLKFLQVRVPDFTTQVESSLWAQRMQESVLPLSREIASMAQRFQTLRRSLLHAAFNGNLTKEWREGTYV